MPTIRSLVRLATRSVRTGLAAPQPPREQRVLAVVAMAYAGAAWIVLHLALLAASELSYYIRDPVYSDKERKLARFERALPPQSPVAVFIGTSRTGNAFDAGRARTALEEALGRPAGAFNFGMPASGPLTHLVHLRRLFADGHRPALVLFEIHPATFARLPDGPLEGRFADGTVFSWEEIDLLGRYGCQTDKLLAKRRRALYKPWYGLRFQLVGRLAPTSLPYYLRHDWSRGPDPHGWNPIMVEDLDAEQKAIGLARADREYKHILKGMQLGDGPVRALRDALALARDRGVPTALVRMPEGSSFRKLYSPEVIARVDQFVADVAFEFGCRVADCRLWMADEAFADGHHLLRASAGEFSERLAREIIAPVLAGGGKR